MKKLTTLILVLCMLGGLLCAAGAEEPQPVTAEELVALGEHLKELAAESELMNDPADESAELESGYMMMYPFGILFADRTELTAETKINGANIEELEEAGFRGLETGMLPAEAAAAFPNGNPEMAGEREEAVLYLKDDANGVVYGVVYRDGQRVDKIEYGQLVPVEGGYQMAVLTCLFSENMLYAATIEGLNPETTLILDEAEKNGLAEGLAAVAGRDDYKAVQMSRNGDAPELGAEDLKVFGLDFLAIQPEDLPGIPETEEIEDDGATLLRVDGDGYTAVFRDADGKKELASFTILSEELEGPRGVRLGDMLHDDLKRFRSEDRGIDDSMTEILYGAENEAPRGIAEFDGEESTLRYVAAAEDGREVELLLRYTMGVLTEIIIHVL